ncbi:MAG: LCP family protein [Clostridium perfringens]|nr:LCP family protein [Clostridium perfringens]
MKYIKLKNFNFIFFLLPLIFFTLFFLFSHNAIKSNNITTDMAKVNDFNDNIPFTEVLGISNILLLSSDARPNEEYSRADSMMILTIDNVNKKLKVTSLLRDMLVSIDGHGEEKLNHSFAYGGPLKTIETIENNFGIKIDNYVIINFNSFRKIVDTLGGISLDIKDYEVSELNKYILDSGGSQNDLISSSGTYTLNGYQALSYARIRKVGDGEYERSSRQRTLINLTLSKIKNASPIKIAQIVKDLFPYIKTNVNIGDAINYSLTTLSIYTKNSSLEQLRLPLDSIAKERLYPSKGWVLVLDKEENSNALKDFIFNDKIYTPNTDNISDIAKEYDLKYGKKKR